MTSNSSSTGLTGQDLRLIRACFLIAALWNFAGAVPAVIDPTGMFAREFGRVLKNNRVD